MSQQSTSTDTSPTLESSPEALSAGISISDIYGDSSLTRMISWLMNDPVRNVKAGKKSFGSFSHGVHAKTGESPGQYTEITGYGVSILAHLYKWHKDELFLQAACDAADFLLSIQLENGAYPNCPDPEQPCVNGEQITFDTSMCLMGIMDLYEIKPEQKYLESGKKAGDWLLSMQREDGSFKAKNLAGGRPTTTGNFFGDGSCIHVKNAMALLKLHAACGEEKYDQGGRKVCDYVLGLQAKEGLFWSMPTKDFVFTHAHCYACEGFISAGAYTGDARYTEAAMKGIKWLQESQNADGSVYQVYADKRGLKKRSRQSIEGFKAADASSQAARLFALAGNGYEENYKRGIAFVKNQMQSPSGGLYYTKGRFRTNYMMYAWVTMFGIQALEFAYQAISPKELF